MTSRVRGLGRGRIFPAQHSEHLLNPLRFLVQPPGRLIRRMGLNETDRVLEIGPGPGWFSPALVRAVPRGSLTLCDVQPEMLQRAMSRMVNVDSAVAVAADATFLPFGGRTFQAVLIACVLGEIADSRACLREVARVLAPGGTLTIAETRRDSDFIPVTRLLDMTSTHGFELRSRFGPRFEYTAVFERVTDQK